MFGHPTSFARYTLAVVLLSSTGIAVQADEAPKNQTNESQTDESVESQAQLESLWQEQGLPLLQSFCVDCHNADFQEAELDLESNVDVAALTAHREHWEKVLQRIRFNTMPPEDADQPSDEERSRLIAAIETVLYHQACDLEPKPGRVTVRRLNRSEYNNTIRDLFGQDLRPADAFPSDEVGAGFDNNGDVLSLPPMLFEKYMTAAEAVAAAVIVDPDSVERIDAEKTSDLLHAIGEHWIGSFYKFYMRSDGIVWAQFKTPYAGNYELRVGGSSGKEGEEVFLGVYDTNGTLLETVKLHYSDGGGRNTQSFRLDLPKGEHRFFVTKVDSPEAAPKELDAVKQLTADQIKESLAKEGNSLEVDREFDRDQVAFAIQGLTLKGPRGIPEELIPPVQNKLITRRPGRDEPAGKLIRPGLSWLMRRAFREPVDDETLDAYVALVEKAHKREDNFHRAMRVGVAAVLVNPRFLYRIELPLGPTNEAGNAFALTNHQLASRLSYFLWSSTPDETLLELADQGKLDDPAVLEEQVKRMLADPKAESLADDFAAQWLGLRNLATIQPDVTQFSTFNEALRAGMLEETRLTFLEVVKNNRSVLDFLDMDQSFMNQQLAEHYGIPDVQGDEFRAVSLSNTTRRGILTQASILTLTSNPTRTSPVKRGKWIMENILGTPPPEPPAGVPELEVAAESNPDAPLREQLEIHRADPACASCHRTMDDLGFGFENFNVVGSYRELDKNAPIDASGELPGGVQFKGPVELIAILKKDYGAQFVRTTTQRLLTFALGRELRFEDRCVVEEIVRKASVDDYRFHRLVIEIVLSPAFRYQQPEGAST